MIYGHDMVQKMLANATASNRLHHALLFWGPPGIGKSALALYLVRLLNCLADNDDIKPCGVCRQCQRIALPFPTHPDVRLLRDISTPLFLPRDQIFERFYAENPFVASPKDNVVETEYLEGIELLVENGNLVRYHCCADANPPVDILIFNKEKLISPSMIEKHNRSSMIVWFFQKLHGYQQTVCYDRYIKIDMIRDIQKMLYLHSFEGRTKAVIIDDADRMLIPAQNSLLKILEEPPKASNLILITGNPRGLLPTIRSRCQRIPFYRLAPVELAEGLVKQFGYTRETAVSVAEKARGSFAEALLTDWVKHADEQARYDALFNAGHMGGIDWVLRVSKEAMGNDASECNDGLSQLYRWLHDKVCLRPNSDSLEGSLPRNRRFTVETALRIMDGITDILGRSNYNLDIRLQFESMLINILKETT